MNYEKKLLFFSLTYLITNSMTWSFLTGADGCIAKVLLNTRWTGLYIQVRRKPSPHSPTELWLVCRELVENLETRIKIPKGFSCRIFRQFYIVNEAVRELFNETHNIKLKVKNCSCKEKLRKIAKPFVSYELPCD